MSNIEPLQYEKTRWRLIISEPASGAWNMALDEALLLSMDKSNTLPTLRLYAWVPPCLSLGYAQPIADVDTHALHAHNWDLVRRPTGGRAILHTDELTYSITAPYTEPRMAGGVLESYRRISKALLHALILLGIPAMSDSTADNPSPQQQKPVCFEVPSKYEITVNGKKIIGSAQARKQSGVLQHGTLPLWGDIRRITQVLHYANETQMREAAEKVTQRATTVADVLGYNIRWETAANAFAEAFETILNIEFVKALPSPEEISLAHKLVEEKYANPAWTGRV